MAALSLNGSSQKDARETVPGSQETPDEPGADRMDLSEGEGKLYIHQLHRRNGRELNEPLPAVVLLEGRDVPSTELGSPMKQSSSNEIPIQQQRGSSVCDRGAMDRETKRSASLHRRIIVLENRERMLKSELKMQRRAITSFAADAREAYHRLAVVELECEYSKRDAWDRTTRYCKWWLSDFQALKDLLEFVAEPNHPDVEQIMSSSSERFAAYRGNDSDTAMI